MDINFGGTSVTNCSVIFDPEGNYGIANNDMWIHGTSWNGKAWFPNGIEAASCRYSVLFNKELILANSVTNMANCFRGCNNFNQNIQIPNSVTNMANCFQGCSNFNQNIQIPNSVTSVSNMFFNCFNFNQNIQIPNSVTAITNMFRNCTNLDQNIQIPSNVVTMNYAFFNCYNLSSVTINDINSNLNHVRNAFRSGSEKTLNIWTGQNVATKLINQGIIQGGITPTWETITNGYYNAQYNVYIYTNAVFN